MTRTVITALLASGLIYSVITMACHKEEEKSGTSSNKGTTPTSNADEEPDKHDEEETSTLSNTASGTVTSNTDQESDKHEEEEKSPSSNTATVTFNTDQESDHKKEEPSVSDPSINKEERGKAAAAGTVVVGTKRKATIDEEEEDSGEKENFLPSLAAPPRRSRRGVTTRRRKMADYGNNDNGNDDDPHEIGERFLEPHQFYFKDALQEITNGQKESCWSWFFLPTAPYVVDGIERGSPMNRRYALRGDDAAKAFLTYKNGMMRKHYILIVRGISSWLRRGSTLRIILGPLDDTKAISSFQLFERIGRDMKDEELESTCRTVLTLCGVYDLDESKKKKKTATTKWLKAKNPKEKNDN